ncbi:4Fe-4S dicluster domain-containing protein [Clostridium niameyense]|uniref:4Fe-4S dicluster domain-containing protein n=1 Tax=Clostridium niameyense TaxID=1622073 RepID=A0A6M0R7L0_9CLOT|nr:4Fe-4S dicluster domain-containing protein [Clostridium niameyense]NEZ46164.1 4Fe-4S dicluster domain-containing protein [Clostridium niameyense]
MANCYVIANAKKCIGCRTCEVACVVSHAGESMFQLKDSDIKFFPKLTVMKNKTVSAPVQCRQCGNPLCMKACPVGAIEIVDRKVHIDREACIGCKSCVVACPFGAIDMALEINEEKVVANKCDLCEGREGGPACVKACPTQALRIVNKDG